MSFERLYIIDPTNFRGQIVNSMSAPSGQTPTHVDYMTVPTTFEEYKKQKGNENLIVLTWEEFEEKYYTPYLNSLQSDWKEITEERWYAMLEVLPPKRWTKFTGGSFFFISEAHTANLHSCFVSFGGKYFEALRDVTLPAEVIIEQIKN